MLSTLNLNKMLRKLLYVFCKLFQIVLSVYELIAPKNSKFPPIFIIGAPRSGSTLLIQVITEAFDIGYMSNSHCNLYGAPALAERLFQPTRNRSKGSFESFHGTTNCLSGPCECGQFWYRFFRRKPAYVGISDISQRDLYRFRLSISTLIASLGKPLVFKNMYASLRIQPILKAFPKACFIITERDEVDNGHSLLVTRKKVFGNYDQWWSMEPPNICDLIHLPPSHQVIQQIRSIHETIESDLHLMNVSSEQFIHVNYEELCENPDSCMRKLSKFFAKNNIKVERTSFVLNSFERNKAVQIPQSLYQGLNDYANKL